MKQFCSFSEAIREGAKLKPQGFKLREDRVDKNTSCALEAGIEAIGCDFEWYEQGALCAMYPYLWEWTAVPVSPRYQDSLYSICYILNDAGWTREQIADWLEQEENRLGYVTLVETVEEQVTVSLSR
jgi:hypothetical protein